MQKRACWAEYVPSIRHIYVQYGYIRMYIHTYTHICTHTEDFGVDYGSYGFMFDIRATNRPIVITGMQICSGDGTPQDYKVIGNMISTGLCVCVCVCVCGY